MSKIETIKQALENNPNLFLRLIDTGTTLLLNKHRTRYDNSEIGHLVLYGLSPKNPIYSIDELQGFMDSLIPNLQPDHKQNFEIIPGHKDPRINYDDSKLYFGHLIFHENIGEENSIRRIVLTDEQLQEICIHEKINLEEIITKELKRSTHIYVYPSKEILEDDVEGSINDNEYRSGIFSGCISLNEINRYKDGTAFRIRVKVGYDKLERVI